MTWQNFFLVCFLVGFIFSVVSFFMGSLHLPHWFHVGGHHGPIHIHHHLDLPPAHHVGMAAAHGGHVAAAHNGSDISPFNFLSIMVFLAWFGGTGYLLTHFYDTWYVLALAIATGVGLLGGCLVFWFLAKVLLKHETVLDPADFEMVGVLAKVTGTIREAGVGEIQFSQAGVRRSAGARSEDGKAIARGTEVVVTKYEKGIAYVRTWEDMTK
jgi:hypothetical protein